jgi:thiosulfate/3-mercaptopyruvate sulfurtransferase
MRFRHLIRSMFVLSILALAAILGAAGPTNGRAPVPLSPEDADSAEPWNATQLVQPADLVQELIGPANSRPLVICVGFEFLYLSAHVPGAVLYGPGREPSGLKALQDAARSWPRNRDIVIYCGCCPMKQCPNLRPAFRALVGMGFTRLRVLDLERDFRQDWLRQGLRIEKSSSK